MRSYKSGASRAAFIVLGGLLASAALVQVLARRAEKAHRPLGKILRVRGRAVHVVERGTGPCVILLHGNGSMVEDFASTGLIDRLAENHRVLAFDRPGFGESDRDGGTWTPEREADLLAEVMQTLGVQTSVVVGHSWGGLVALSMALRDPASITGLVLLSGYYYPTTRLDVAHSNARVASGHRTACALYFLAVSRATMRTRRLQIPLFSHESARSFSQGIFGTDGNAAMSAQIIRGRYRHDAIRSWSHLFEV